MHTGDICDESRAEAELLPLDTVMTENTENVSCEGENKQNKNKQLCDLDHPSPVRLAVITSSGSDTNHDSTAGPYNEIELNECNVGSNVGNNVVVSLSVDESGVCESQSRLIMSQDDEESKDWPDGATRVMSPNVGVQDHETSDNVARENLKNMLAYLDETIAADHDHFLRSVSEAESQTESRARREFGSVCSTGVFRREHSALQEEPQCDEQTGNFSGSTCDVTNTNVRSYYRRPSVFGVVPCETGETFYRDREGDLTVPFPADGSVTGCGYTSEATLALDIKVEKLTRTVTQLQASVDALTEFQGGATIERLGGQGFRQIQNRVTEFETVCVPVKECIGVVTKNLLRLSFALLCSLLDVLTYWSRV